MTDPYQTFMQHLKLSDELIAQSSKELIAETARVLALIVAGYRAKYGEVPSHESLRLLRVEQLSDDDVRMLVTGLETLVGVLGALRQDDSGGAVH